MQVLRRSRDRVAEGAPLLREYVGKTCIKGSNPFDSAKSVLLVDGPSPRGAGLFLSAGLTTQLRTSRFLSWQKAFA
jgi:hypothetical protein